MFDLPSPVVDNQLRADPRYVGRRDIREATYQRYPAYAESRGPC